MLWDPELNQIVVFGGNGGTPTGYGNDICTYNPTTTRWTNIEPFEYCPGSKGFDKPNGSDGMAFEYDPYNNVLGIWLAPAIAACSLTWTNTAGAGTTTTMAVDPTPTPPQSGSYVAWTVRVSDVTARVTAYDAALGKLTLERPIPALAAGVVFKLYATSAPASGTDPLYEEVGRTGHANGTNRPHAHAHAVCTRCSVLRRRSRLCAVRNLHLLRGPECLEARRHHQAVDSAACSCHRRAAGYG